MDITEIPFNRFLGIKKSPGDGPHRMPSFRAGRFARLTEITWARSTHQCKWPSPEAAAAAEYLLRTFQGADAGVLAVVVRRVQAKFKNLVTGKIFAMVDCAPEELARFSSVLDAKGKALVSVSVDIADAAGLVAMTAVIEWFIQRPKQVDTPPYAVNRRRQLSPSRAWAAPGSIGVEYRHGETAVSTCCGKATALVSRQKCPDARDPSLRAHSRRDVPATEDHLVRFLRLRCATRRQRRGRSLVIVPSLQQPGRRHALRASKTLSIRRFH